MIKNYASTQLVQGVGLYCDSCFNHLQNLRVRRNQLTQRVGVMSIGLKEDRVDATSLYFGMRISGRTEQFTVT